MSDGRWAAFYAMASSMGVFPKTLDWRSAYTLAFLPPPAK
jgi:NitT/TauT family transport system substrate-binding protein